MKLTSRLTVLLVIICAGTACYTQSTDYSPFSNDPEKERILLSAITKKYEQDLSALSGSYKKHTADIYRERFESIKERLTEKELITDARAQGFLSAITNEIVTKNPALLNSSSLRVCFSRAYWPNAASMGEGTILFNIGLFNRLDNEAQAAFVICHELAHYYLNHSNNSIQQYVQTVNSDEFQRQLRNIKHTQYGQNSEIEKLVLNLSFRSHRHSREFEKAADSMAVELLKNTSYDLNEALSCLGLLDSVDKDKYQEQLMLDKTFDCTAYPFKKRWLINDHLAFTDTKEELAKKHFLDDSLKTHPDCKIRINNLERMVKQYQGANTRKFILDEAKFKELRQAFDYEILDYCFQSGRISRCLYMSLQMLKAFPQSPYLNGMTGKCLNKLYAAQKDHEIGKLVDLPNPYYDEEYNTLLNFIQNIRLQELAAITYYFLQSRQETARSSEEYVAALIISKENFDKPEEKKEWINYYQTHFTNRKYNF